MYHHRFDYSPINQRNKLEFPNGAKVALWVIPNIEHFHYDRPSISISPAMAKLTPDVMNYSWRDYGVRVGIWRMMDIMNKYGVKGTAALNSDVCEFYPEIIRAGQELGWEWMGHGTSNSFLINNLEEDKERAIIRNVLDTIEKSTGQRPKGWLSPSLSETLNTPDLLAEEGVEYTANWVNDDQPYPFHVRKNHLYSIPYSMEINDVPAILGMKRSAEEFYQMIKDQFDVLYADGEHNPRVMSICLHPFIMGQPHRSKYLDFALQYITSHHDVWMATGWEIISWYKETTR
jgi:allantoinase